MALPREDAATARRKAFENSPPAYPKGKKAEESAALSNRSSELFFIEV
jgi:hypothetical protein